MRMYELWKIPLNRYAPARLEDAAGAVLFEYLCDAERYAKEDPDRWDAVYTTIPVTVGTA